MTFLQNDRGQDLIEYVLLASFLALVGLAGVQVLGNAMRDSYGQQNQGVQDIWETPPPLK